MAYVFMLSSFYRPRVMRLVVQKMDISLIIEITVITFHTDVKNIHMEGIVSQILYLGLSFYFI